MNSILVDAILLIGAQLYNVISMQAGYDILRSE